ncbi:MAG: outer membrane protein assembly factor BamD [Planctomycetota bacterium]
MRFLILTCFSTMFLVGLSGCQSFDSSAPLSKRKNLFGLNRNPMDQVDSDELLDPLGARDANRMLLDDFAPDQIATTLKVRTRGGRDETKAQQHYQRGQQRYQEAISILESRPEEKEHVEIFVDAANDFRMASAYWPDSAVDEDALYFEGESYFFADRYVQSNRAFEKLVARYPGSKHLDLAENRRYAIAIYWLQLAETGSGLALNDPKRPKTGLKKEARRVLHRIRIDDPTGKLADDATLTLGKAFMRDKRYYEAADTLEDLRKNYPGSKHQFDAHMLELEARLMSYQGQSYDDTPLRKADEILKSIIRMYPKKSKENLEYLEQQSAAIQNQLADRDLALAQYFENRGENRAAKFHYELIAERFEGSEIETSIRERIAEVEKKPPSPEQHAQWLVNLFPDPEKAKPVIMAGNNEPIFRR